MIAIGLTDHDWFTFLREGPIHREVNFWTPTPWGVSSLRDGDHFYFLLKAPVRKVGGYGRFAAYEEMPASEAWNRYGLTNGVTDLTNLIARTMKYVGKHNPRIATEADPVIGCIVLRKPVLFDDDDFFSPEDRGAPVPRQVVKFKTFPDIDALDNPNGQDDSLLPFRLVTPNGAIRRTGLTTVRPQQQHFRYSVIRAYGSVCAVTGETCTEVLEAAHIQPYVDERSNDVRNGILLRTDLHTLFDAGLLTIDGAYRVRVSPFLRSDTYTALDGKQIRLPVSPNHRPSSEAFAFHRRSVFRRERIGK